MRLKDQKVQLTLAVPFDAPDLNGVKYSQNAIERAVSSLCRLPIVYRGDWGGDDIVIGVTDANPISVSWGSEHQVCNVVLDGEIFFGGADIVVNSAEVRDGIPVVTDFTIKSVGISK